MTKAIEICREAFTEDQLNKLCNRASWDALFPVALEMGFTIIKLAALNYNYTQLRDLMRQTWREKVVRFEQCQACYTKLRKENEKQRQIVMAFHLEGKDQ